VSRPVNPIANKSPIMETKDFGPLTGFVRLNSSPLTDRIRFMDLSNFLRSERNIWPPFLIELEGNYTSLEIKLTIVVPSYNAANFISETLSRIKDFPSTEILLLDDGSSDETVNISRKIMNGHPNYGIFQLTHKGSPGQARNLGMQIARGKWVWFLDCDDLPIVNNVDSILAIASELNSNVCILSYLVRYDQGSVWDNSFDKVMFTKLCQSNYAIFSNWLAEPELVRLSPHPSRVIYLKEFLHLSGLLYDVDENFEDGSFWPKALFSAENILLWNWPTTMYRVRNNSISYSRELGRKLFLLTQFDKIFKELQLKDSSFEILWGPTYMYALEMIAWPLNILGSKVRIAYRKAARNTLESVGGKWFINNPSITLRDRVAIFKTLVKFNCWRLALSCLAGIVK
jgi:glycosyltransferase involved in cell wall biosynthesis